MTVGTVGPMVFWLIQVNEASLLGGIINHDESGGSGDGNKDGRLTREEMQAFMHGTRRSVPQQ